MKICVCLQAMNQSMGHNGVLQGILFWLWDARNEGQPPDQPRTTNQGITSSDSTWCGLL